MEQGNGVVIFKIDLFASDTWYAIRLIAVPRTTLYHTRIKVAY